MATVLEETDWENIMAEATTVIIERKEDFSKMKVSGSKGIDAWIRNRIPMAAPILLPLRKSDKIDGIMLAIKANNDAMDKFNENVVRNDGSEGDDELDMDNGGGRRSPTPNEDGANVNDFEIEMKIT